MMKFPLLSLTVLNNDNSAVMACLPITHIFALKIIPRIPLCGFTTLHSATNVAHYDNDLSPDSFSILKTQLRCTRWWVEWTLALASYVHKRFVPETLAVKLKKICLLCYHRDCWSQICTMKTYRNFWIFFVILFQRLIKLVLGFQRILNQGGENCSV